MGYKTTDSGHLLYRLRFVVGRNGGKNTEDPWQCFDGQRGLQEDLDTGGLQEHVSVRMTLG
jgi:hypothetical protein